MPSIHRTFYIPVNADPSPPKISIELREPSLTADNLGHKTWAASYLLAKRLALLLPLLPAIARPGPQSIQSIPSIPLDVQNRRSLVYAEGSLSLPHILDLGAGTGLTGIAAAGVLHAQVDLTDLPEICENLAYNCQHNGKLISELGGSMITFSLDWSESMSDDTTHALMQYDIILAADPLYSPNHAAILANTIARYLKRESTSRVIIELPLRDAYQPEISDLRERMEGNYLSLIAQGEEIGYDDWASGTTEVRCWWGLWGCGDLQSVESNLTTMGTMSHSN